MMSSPAPFHESRVEAVPAVTQLAALSFSSAICGVLLSKADSVRVVLHRVLSRSGQSYLQQASPYAGSNPIDHSLAGRINPFSTGIIGFSLKNLKVSRTRKFDSVESLETAIKSDMTRVGDDRKFDQVALSYLAIPMQGADGKVASILYADSMKPNLFVDIEIVHVISEMCRGFCKTMDELIDNPIPRIENFSLEAGEPIYSSEDVYWRVQETLDEITIPSYKKLSSFNFETTRY